mmetsp:Transcript_39300/g.98756  ORF Transcript_39300/g.98756 Transcript_39300/m.98756 type:complete len:209 (-) Transcript_39300:78-704(-)
MPQATKILAIGGDQAPANTSLIAPSAVPSMNPNQAAVTLAEGEKILRTYKAKHGLCHVVLPADDTSQTILTNKRLITSVADNNYCCLVIPTGEYTRVSESYELDDVVHVAGVAYNPGYCGLSVFTNMFCPPPSELRISVSRPGLVAGWLNVVYKHCFTGVSMLLPGGSVAQNTGKEVCVFVKRGEIQTAMSDVQSAVRDVRKTANRSK